MGTSLVLEMEREVIEAKLRTLPGNKMVSVAEASDLVAHAIEATGLLRRTWEYPRRALGETGLDTADFKAICQKVRTILDMHLTLLDLIRRAAMAASSHECKGVPNLEELDLADAKVREARRKIEDLFSLASRSRGGNINWARVREGEEAIARGEVVRLNPDAQSDKASVS